jgi:hypothetical protein
VRCGSGRAAAGGDEALQLPDAYGSVAVEWLDAAQPCILVSTPGVRAARP